MAHILEPFVGEYSITTGSGDLQLAGAINGYRTFDDVAANGDQFHLVITLLSGSLLSEFEEGLYSYDAANNRIVNVAVYKSSNSNNKVSWSAGTKRVMLAPGSKQQGFPFTASVGDLVYRDANGWQRLAKGSAGQFLRQNAGLTAPEWSSGWETIGSDPLSAVASWSRTDLGAFRKLRVSGWARPATDGINGGFRTSTNNGASYANGASDYGIGYLWQSSTTVAGSALNANALYMNVTTTIGADTEEGIMFEAIFDQWNQATHTWMTARAFWRSTDGSYSQVQVAGMRENASARNALQFVFSSGNIAAGHIVLEGIRG